MAGETNEVKQGEHVDIPAVSSISGRIAVRGGGMSQALWERGGSLAVFVMAAALVVLPAVLLILLLRQPDTGPNGLTWLWIVMGVITEAIAFMAAFGLVRSVLESER